jgi:hypothetical protein
MSPLPRAAAKASLCATTARRTTTIVRTPRACGASHGVVRKGNTAMWKIISIRRNYYTTEQVLVWVKNLEALLDLLPLLNTDACTCHNFNPED